MKINIETIFDTNLLDNFKITYRGDLTQNQYLKWGILKQIDKHNILNIRWSVFSKKKLLLFDCKYK